MNLKYLIVINLAKGHHHQCRATVSLFSILSKNSFMVGYLGLESRYLQTLSQSALEK